jgi:hypothetical protein
VNENQKRIVDSPRGVENASPSPERPLAGLVHITGIGQVTFKMIRAELERRAIGHR